MAKVLLEKGAATDVTTRVRTEFPLSHNRPPAPLLLSSGENAIFAASLLLSGLEMLSLVHCCPLRPVRRPVGALPFRVACSQACALTPQSVPVPSLSLCAGRYDSATLCGHAGPRGDGEDAAGEGRGH